jgi:signal peptidase I
MSNITIDFPLILTALVLVTGLICLIDALFFAKKRSESGEKKSILIEYARSFFPVLLIVWVVRSFIVQPYRVPTGSLEPTIMPGDFIIVKQYAYGLRFPVTNTKMMATGEPKRGDIILFWPPDHSDVFVKRLVGLPGDHIVYKNKTLSINGKEMPQTSIEKTYDTLEDGRKVPVEKKQEDLMGIKHDIYLQMNNSNNQNDVDVTVPAGHYFMMGDNRDDSADSRVWGFVPDKDLIGQAFGVWMSWDNEHARIRWDRIGKALH